MKRYIIAIYLMVLNMAIFAQNAESDFIVDNNGVITKYEGWSTTVIIPETINGIRVTGIGDRVFSSNDLTGVTIPRSITFIGIEAFSNNKLTNITIPGDNVLIGSRAFNGNSITAITLGNNHVFTEDIVPRIRLQNRTETNSSLFYDYICNDRKAGTYLTNQPVSNVKNTDDYQYIETRYGVFITGYTGSSHNRLIIPSQLAGLSVKAISGFRNISRVQIPDSVTYIGNEAFISNQLTTVTIPDSVTYIGNHAFAGNELTSVSLGNKITYIGNGAFSQNKLISVAIPDSVTYIGFEAFGSNQLTNLVIGNNVTHVGNGAFQWNQLTSVIIPESITYISERTFAYNQLTDINIPDTVIYIGERAFEGSQLTSVTIPDSVKYIGNIAFNDIEQWKNQLISITIGNNVTIDGEYPGSFGNGFENVYNNNGKAAGVYTRPDNNSGNWTRQ